MHIKWTFTRISAYLDEYGYKPLEPVEGCTKKFLAKCPKGHEIKIVFDRFRRGVRCPVCVGGVGHTHKMVAQVYKDFGYTLRSTYKNSNTILDIECDKGHIYQSRYTYFQSGKGRCHICKGGVRYTHEYVEKQYLSEGYKLESIYKNNSTNMTIVCPEGHRTEAKYICWQAGARCSVCNGGKRHTVEYIKSQLKKENYTFLDKEYTNAFSKINAMCPLGHIYKTTYSTWQKGCRCTVCAKSGFDPNKYALFYYLRFETSVGNLYKMGITNRTIEARYCTEKTPYTVLYEELFILGNLAKEKESELKLKFKKYKYKGPKLLESGNTELFIKDVLKLDR